MRKKISKRTGVPAVVFQRRVSLLATRWERKALDLQKAAKDSGNELLAVAADTRLQDVWELRAEMKKQANDDKAEPPRTENL